MSGRHSNRAGTDRSATGWGGFRLLAASLIALCGIAGTARGDEPPTFNREIRPILSEHCFACHGPDSAARKAELRLDSFEGATEDRGGYASIVPGDPDASELIYRVESEDELDVMPPPSMQKPLSVEQKDLLRRWVASGATYEPHWSFIAPNLPAIPEVSDPTWVRNPIDAFVLARLDAEGLSPASEADRRTLARRLSLDLNGLPPEPDAVEAFVRDQSPDAYDNFVDLLLDSPRWGEHRARYWLDAARYADTHGLHHDNYREMWSFRDWVIDAYNANMPFDQFTIEQLAGDLLPEPTLDQLVASGFNRCNISTNEGGTILEENLVGYTRDRTETTSTVWLGMTAGCAVCHDHKFDPLSQREFYGLSAFFNNTTISALDLNIKDTPPTVFVPHDRDRGRWESLLDELETTRDALDARQKDARPAFDAWLESASPESLSQSIPDDGLLLRARLGDGATPSAGGIMEVAEAGDFDRDQPFTAAAWVSLPKSGMSGAVVARMDDRADFRGWDLWIERGRVGTHIVHRWPENALKVVSQATLEPGRWTHILVSYDGSSRADGVAIAIDGVPQKVTVAKDALTETIRTEVPLTVGQRRSTSILEGASIRDLRLFGVSIEAEDAGRIGGGDRARRFVEADDEDRSAEERQAVFEWWLATLDESSRDLRLAIGTLEREESSIRSRGTEAHVMNERDEPASAFVLHRGEYDQRREEVAAETPAILPAMDPDAPRDRLGLARWLMRPDHPLTARVTVNRAWQEVFGQGLVASAGDFGITGQLPSHPDLLDWLAVDFRDSGWDVKHLYRRIVTSATYRQSAAASAEKRARDGDNRLLSRGPRFRMDAEMVRDYALAASGLLVEELGGPSVRPYQPPGVWAAVAMPESNTKNYEVGDDDDLYRRSLYTFWKRAAPPASMDVFNAPNRETCTVQRERTNTPLQALVTLNDTQFIEAARHLAGLAIQTAKTTDQRIAMIAERLLARPFRPEERDIVQESLIELMAYYREHPADAEALLDVGASAPIAAIEPAELAAWTMLTNELMNLDEVLNK